MSFSGSSVTLGPIGPISNLKLIKSWGLPPDQIGMQSYDLYKHTDLIRLAACDTIVVAAFNFAYPGLYCNLASLQRAEIL